MLLAAGAGRGTVTAMEGLTHFDYASLATTWRVYASDADCSLIDLVAPFLADTPLPVGRPALELAGLLDHDARCAAVLRIRALAGTIADSSGAHDQARREITELLDFLAQPPIS